LGQRIGDAIQRCYDRRKPNDAAARNKKEKETLSETAQQKIDRLVNANWNYCEASSNKKLNWQQKLERKH